MAASGFIILIQINTVYHYIYRIIFLNLLMIMLMTNQLLYDQKLDGKEVNKATCFRYLNCSPDFLMQIAGIHHSELVRYSYTIKGEYPNIKLTLNGNGLSIGMTLHLDIQTLYINSMEIEPKSTGLGLRIFNAQVRNAFKLGITTIECLADGCYATILYLNGYITCGKFGFSMNQASQEMFNNLMLLHGRTEQDLQSLFKSKSTPVKPSGEDFWKTIGKRWYGVFQTSEESENKKILQKYNFDKLRGVITSY